MKQSKLTTNLSAIVGLKAFIAHRAIRSLHLGSTTGHSKALDPAGGLWRAREGAGWRAVPERYGRWNSVWRRHFARWRDLALFEAVFAALAGSGAAEERLQMLDATVVRAHQSTPPAPRGAGRTGAGPLPRRLLDQAAPALRHGAWATARHHRPHARADGREPRSGGPGRGHGAGHAPPDRRHGLRCRPDQAGPAAPRRPAGGPSTRPARRRCRSTASCTAEARSDRPHRGGVRRRGPPCPAAGAAPPREARAVQPRTWSDRDRRCPPVRRAPTTVP